MKRVIIKELLRFTCVVIGVMAAYNLWDTNPKIIMCFVMADIGYHLYKDE